jgi:hypothetical protein
VRNRLDQFGLKPELELMKKSLLILALFVGHISFAQDVAKKDTTKTAIATADSTKKDTTESNFTKKFNEFNKKGEYLFTILPVPLYSYSIDAGNIVGLAKYNLVNLNKSDTISQPSKFSELITVSSLGRVKVSVGTDLIWDENNYMMLGYIYYKKQEEYIFGIGNDVTREDIEEYGSSEFRFVNTLYKRVYEKLYVGLGFDISDYTQIEYSDTSFLAGPNIVGNVPNTNFGITFGAFDDTRKNRYNPQQGHFAAIKYTAFPEFIGGQYDYGKLFIDLRKYFNPWYKHIIAMQTTLTYCDGEVPFYDMGLMGGSHRMRGYYKGAIRDNVLFDCQIAYRLPIWNIFGAAAWLGTGRVAPDFSAMEISGFWLDYGFGLRIMVDEKNQTNLRFDLGFGNDGIRGFYINFAEAF